MLNDSEMKSQLREIEISYHRPEALGRVTSSADVNIFCRRIWKGMDHHETFVILVLSRAHEIMGYKVISQGGVSGTVVDPKLVFQTLLKCHASSTVIVHNHPSGQLKPSKADLQLTDKLLEGGRLLEITVLDHLILTTEGYLSFSDEGLM